MEYRGEFILNFISRDDIHKDGINITNLINEYDVGNTLPLQDAIGKYIKKRYSWITSIGLIDAMDIVFKDAKSNGNIK